MGHFKKIKSKKMKIIALLSSCVLGFPMYQNRVNPFYSAHPKQLDQAVTEENNTHGNKGDQQMAGPDNLANFQQERRRDFLLSLGPYCKKIIRRLGPL